MIYGRIAATAIPCIAAVLLATGCGSSRDGSRAGDRGAGEGMGPMSPQTDIPDSPGRVPANDPAGRTGGSGANDGRSGQ